MTEPALAQTTGVIPWQAEPRRLWSLLDMLRLNAPLFMRANTAFVEGASALRAEPDRLFDRINLLEQPLQQMRHEHVFATLSKSFKQHATEFQADIRSGMSNTDLAVCCDKFVQALHREFHNRFFLEVAPERQKMFANPREWWGYRATDVFPEAQSAVHDCVECFVYEKWNASVMHAMCVLEIGLKYLADRLKIKLKSDPRGWQEVIGKLQDAIKGLPDATQRQKLRKERFSKAAIQVANFKHAWRNWVMHNRREYAWQEADLVVRAVRDFMREMAKWRSYRPSGRHQELLMEDPNWP